MKRTLHPQPGERYLARHVLHRGVDHTLSTVHITPDGRVVIEPFAAETPATIFIDGRISVEYINDKPILINQNQ